MLKFWKIFKLKKTNVNFIKKFSHFEWPKAMKPKKHNSVSLNISSEKGLP